MFLLLLKLNVVCYHRYSMQRVVRVVWQSVLREHVASTESELAGPARTLIPGNLAAISQDQTIGDAAQ